jgi:hypothetical protein
MSNTPPNGSAAPQPGGTTPPSPTQGNPGQPPARPVPDFNGVFPYLNPAQWNGKSSCVCRPLMNEQRMPSVSFGRDLFNGIGMIMIRTACEEGYTIGKLEVEAVKNLSSRPEKPEWQTNEVKWEGTMRTIHWRSGDERTASDLLDGGFLEAMHETMDCQDVVLAIPSSSMMIACPRDMAGGLSPVAKQQYADLQSQGIEVLTPLLISVIEGSLRGFFDMDEITEDFNSPGPDTEAS